MLYVVETASVSNDPRATLYREFERIGREMMDNVIGAASRARIRTSTGRIARGDPHQAILDSATEYDIDLIVMGIHDRIGFERFLTGSVTERVVRLTDVPVLSVKPNDVEQSPTCKV